MKVRPLTYFGISFGATACLLAVSIVRLDQARAAHAYDEIQKLSANVFYSSVTVAFLLVVFLSRQLPAFLYVATLAVSRSKSAVVVTHWGSATLNDATSSTRGYFSRCLVASRSGLLLWAPFHQSSRLDWTHFEEFAAQYLDDLVTEPYVEHPTPRVVIRVTRSEPAANLLFLPHSRSFAGWGRVTKGEVEDKLRKLLAMRPMSSAEAS